MRTTTRFADWFTARAGGRQPTFQAPGLGKLGLFDSKQSALQVVGDRGVVYLRRFGSDDEWAELTVSEARTLGENLLAAVRAVEDEPR